MAEPETRPEGGSFLSRIPTWGWVGIATVGGVLVIVWWKNRNSSAASDTSAPASVSDSDSDVQSELDSLAAQIRDLQGDNSTTGDSGGTAPPPWTEKSPDPGQPANPVVIGAPTPVPTKPAPTQRKFVEVVKYVKGQKPDAPSTLSGIVLYLKERGVTTTVAKLKSLNGLSSTVIKPGEKIYYT